MKPLVTDTGFQIRWEYIFDIVTRRRWYILIPFIIAIAAGIYLAITLPRYYRAETLILIQEQKVPKDYIQSVVSEDAASRIKSISQHITSRTNLEKIINEFKLFSEPGQEALFSEEKVGILKKRIRVDVIKGHDRRASTSGFSISYKGKNPEKVMRVTNTLATYFIDENLKVREAMAMGTNIFLEDELKQMRKRLEGKEQALKQYREKNMGGLPEQLDSNLRILDRFQENLGIKQEALSDAKNGLALLENQLFEKQKEVKAFAGVPGASADTPPEDEDILKLRELKTTLADLSAKYTDQHPDLIRTRKSIDKLQKTIRNKPQAEPKLLEQPSETVDASRIDNARSLLLLQIEEAKAEIRSLNSEISSLHRQIKNYQKRIEETPKREQELLSLNRDYQNIKETYNSLSNRKLEADLAVNMEKKQKGEQFRIIDTARLPTKPVEPDMKRLFLMTLFVGLGIGAGISAFLEYSDSSFRRPEEIQSLLGYKVLAAVPIIQSHKGKIRNRLNNLFTYFSIFLSLLMLAVFAAVTFKETEIYTLFIRRVFSILTG